MHSRLFVPALFAALCATLLSMKAFAQESFSDETLEIQAPAQSTDESPLEALADAPEHKAKASSEFSEVRLQVLNKVTARVSEISAGPNERASYGSIDIEVRSCWQAARDEKPETAAMLEIREHLNGAIESHVIFRGWMFASSPALSALEHPVYDVTLLGCTL